MHTNHIGALQRHEFSPPVHGGLMQHRAAFAPGGTATLTPPELRRLVAAMVD